MNPKPKLIIIRGNSASGKSTLANKLAAQLPQEKTLVLHQDMLRRELLHANDHQGTPAVALIETLAGFSRSHYRFTIIEGILRRDVYGEMLERVKATFSPSVWSYYLDLPFTETMARDASKSRPFGELTLRRWWQDQDQLSGDQIVHNCSTTILADQIIAAILADE